MENTTDLQTLADSVDLGLVPPTSKQKYEDEFKRFQNFLQNKATPGDYSATTITAYLAQLDLCGYAVSTLKTSASMLKKCF